MYPVAGAFMADRLAYEDILVKYVRRSRKVEAGEPIDGVGIVDAAAFIYKREDGTRHWAYPDRLQ